MKTIVALMSALAVGAPAAGQTAAKLQESRYQIGQMERVLEGAVEHGATVMRDRLRDVLPADMLLTENARVRGFRLEGYGMLFDVEVPSLQGATLWSFRTLDQNDLGLQSALNALRSHVNAVNDTNLQQALKRIELQVDPQVVSVGGTQVAQTSVQATTGSGARADHAGNDQAAEPNLKNVVEEWRTEIKNALMDAMLEHSRGLGIGAEEWLVVAARGNYDRPPLAPADSEAQTVIIRVRGNDLSAFLGGQISNEEARRRMDVKVF